MKKIFLLICAVLLLVFSLKAQTKWAKTFGGAGDERCYSVCETQDGGVTLAGYTETWGKGERDFWIVKIDKTGMVEW